MGLMDLAERKGAEGDFNQAERYYKARLFFYYPTYWTLNGL